MGEFKHAATQLPTFGTCASELVAHIDKNSPGEISRPETGPMQFKDDWPGVFIRGDDALVFAQVVAKVLDMLDHKQWVEKSVMNGLGRLLASCSVGNTGWPPTGGDGVAQDETRTEPSKGVPGDGRGPPVPNAGKS
jgi:hypothetical protein